MILVGRPLTGKGLVSKNSNKRINASPLSPDILGQGCATGACYCVVIVAEYVFKYQSHSQEELKIGWWV